MENGGFVMELEDSKKADKQTESDVVASTPTHTFEEAVSLVPVGKFHYYMLLVGGLCFMTVMVEVTCVSIILPSMKCDLVSTVAEQGMLASSGFLGIVLSSHAMGFFADTWGRIKTLRAALAFAAISSLISAFSVNIWMMIFFRFLTGFLISGGQACVFSLTGEFHGNKSRTKHVTLLSGFLPLSIMYLPTLAAFVLPIRIETVIFGMKFSSWRLLLISNCVPSLLALFGLFLMPETPKYVLIQGQHDRALEILRWMFVKNTGKPVSEYPVRHITIQNNGANLANITGIKDAVKLVWNQTAPLFYRERCLHTINICIIQFVVLGIAQGIFMWFPTLLNEMVSTKDFPVDVCNTLSNMDPTTNLHSDICNGIVDLFPFMVIAAVGGAFTFFYLFFSFTIDMIGKKNLILTWIIIATICVALLHWITNFYVNIVLLTFTMSVGNVGGLISTISMEFFPTNINAMGMCFVMMMGRIGAVVGSNVLGLLLFDYCELTMWVILGIYAVVFFMSCFLPVSKYEQRNKVVHATSN
ncbi:putative transporter svop-1 [Stomoxys calcitrans]|uniref:Major facilitator superfamily (MFS) profile domain-containing protein n=1 Tax=Stomoxys calcitrans TaxID=35570 RepID=A0A1I8P8J6_STOCA|nr:putative transporter svop-1 [Stomoxys calcitrans]